MATYQEQAETARRELASFKERVIQVVVDALGEGDAENILEGLDLEMPSRSFTWKGTWDLTLKLELSDDFGNYPSHWKVWLEDAIDWGEMRRGIISHLDDDLFDGDIENEDCLTPEIALLRAEEDDGWLIFDISMTVGGSADLSPSADRPGDLADFLQESIADRFPRHYSLGLPTDHVDDMSVDDSDLTIQSADFD